MLQLWDHLHLHIVFFSPFPIYHPMISLIEVARLCFALRMCHYCWPFHVNCAESSADWINFCIARVKLFFITLQSQNYIRRVDNAHNHASLLEIVTFYGLERDVWRRLIKEETVIQLWQIIMNKKKLGLVLWSMTSAAMSARQVLIRICCRWTKIHVLIIRSNFYCLIIYIQSRTNDYDSIISEAISSCGNDIIH